MTIKKTLNKAKVSHNNFLLKNENKNIFEEVANLVRPLSTHILRFN